MPRYYDMDELAKLCESKAETMWGAGKTAFLSVGKWLKLLPPADVVEVVRCKDCKYWSPMDNGISWHHKGRTDGECSRLWEIHNAERHLTKDEHFCSYGERKEQK